MRKGISFTLTIIIVGVVLLTAALTLVTIFGSGIGSIFGTATDTGEQAAIRNACNNVVRQIDSQICEAYVGPVGDITDLSRTRNPSAGYEDTCNEAGCALAYNDFDQNGDPAIRYFYRDTSDYISIEVSVDGNEYNCQDQGYLPSSCPVN